MKCMMSYMLQFVCIFVASLIVSVNSACPRTPTGLGRLGPKLSGDGGFSITIGMQPELYIGGSHYVATIQSNINRRFYRLLMTVESSNQSSANEDSDPAEVGYFMLSDPEVGYSDHCVNTIVESNQVPKTSISATWVAPKRASTCVTIRAMVFVDELHWYSDEGLLSRRLCPFKEQSTVVPKQCCACDDAKYKMIFQGLWSNITHPKDFPFILPLTHFSDVIGATHGRDFKFWGEGVIATDGLKQLAEWGSPGLLHKELLSNSKKLKTLIQAAGLWYPDVNGNTSSKFHVDRSRNLLSIVSMLGPSPDWLVGVSSLDLCLENCTWIEEKVIDLYPYDAGTDNGITYMSPNSPTVPREPAKRISSTYPEDPRSPFYDPSGKEMPPLARIHLKRTKLVEKSCDRKTEDELLQEVAVAENNEDSERSECQVSDYSEWSACSVSCGKGLRSRTRQYLDSRSAKNANCDRQLVAKEMCVSTNKYCPGEEEEEEDKLEDLNEMCRVKEWSRWSSCSTTCDMGIKMRTRTFENRQARKHCQHINTVEKEKCMMPPCTNQEKEDPLCPTTPWSEWSPCSATCGPGVSIRTRELLNKDDRCKSRVQLNQQFSCHQEDCVFDLETAKEVCVLAEAKGPCTGQFERWRFEPRKGMCVPFLYGGCRGNRNNFATDIECLNLCSVVRDMLSRSGSAPDNSTINSTVVVGDGEPHNCVVSGWSQWSECSVTCGQGIKSKKRTVLIEPKNGGIGCPSLQVKRRCHRHCPGYSYA
ncbi:spondin-1 [Nilaparvata lugens]|uniref:spondin-1 n=2 Tax=Nilaparvata lugens TaxID=108931 RepID=UPI000B994C00|nr:spondin-1 [Nilaparvata lugens]